MTKLLLIFALFTGIFVEKYPKDISGKWAVDNVEIGEEAAKKIPQQQRDLMLMMAAQVFATATLEFKADHSVVITADVPNIPKGGKWDYDAKTGLITVTGPPNKQGKPNILQINASEKSGTVYFQIAKAPVMLTMVRKK